ncbi:hypothetical protein PILCRDRAFT_825138 [Piloderma croceum F 1598]|uniref:ABC-2 type transporter transmembrane domain-containing protein n=1 Tax=Piloderma croceum (strain F 1598) TaxID=765440 RepID=A0A0C3EYV2_PILCF|nr:hypothetical protein PILCRDRAFT_825138 [Piloderma croceum F 1598]
MAQVKHLTQETNMVCIATIHQPNWEVFSLFDRLTLLSAGRVMYNGPGTIQVLSTQIQAIAIVNTELYDNALLHQCILTISHLLGSRYNITADYNQHHTFNIILVKQVSESWEVMRKAFILTQHNFVNYVRNLLGFGIRIGMVATIWIHLGTSTGKINDHLSVFFFSVAYLAVFVRERSNGLYGPGAYVLANTFAVVPFLFACTVLFVVICYWAIGLHPGAKPFFCFTLYLFLRLIIQNDVKGLTFQCPTINGSCLCPFASSLVPAQCALTGDDIVKNLRYEGANNGLYVGVLITIVVFYRMAMWAMLAIRKR